MRSESPAIAPFLRSETQARMLAELLLSPTEFTMSELAQATDAQLPTIQREVERLDRAQIITSRKVGRSRLVRANQDYPLYDPLAKIIAATHGPAGLVDKTFSTLSGVREIIIFGSWAARMAGIKGPFPRDVDVILVGDVNRLDAYDAAGNLSNRIGREINVTIVSSQRWHDVDDGFIQNVKSNPMIAMVKS